MTIATDMLQKYIDAETAVLAGQSVRFGNRIVTKANLIEIQQGRREWQRLVDAEQRTKSGGSSIRHLLPDFSE
jgi:hypothetical protein